MEGKKKIVVSKPARRKSFELHTYILLLSNTYIYIYIYIYKLLLLVFIYWEESYLNDFYSDYIYMTIITFDAADF